MCLEWYCELSGSNTWTLMNYDISCDIHVYYAEQKQNYER
jgi:hypothetical protein